MELILFEAVKIFLASYTVSRFSPIQMILELLPNKLIYNLIKLLMSCSRCFALWFGMLLTGDIWLSMSVSMFMVVFEKTFGVWENKVKLN